MLVWLLDLQFRSRFLCAFYMFDSVRFRFGKQNFDWLVRFGLGRMVKHCFGRSLIWRVEIKKYIKKSGKYLSFGMEFNYAMYWAQDRTSFFYLKLPWSHVLFLSSSSNKWRDYSRYVTLPWSVQVKNLRKCFFCLPFYKTTLSSSRNPI